MLIEMKTIGVGNHLCLFAIYILTIITSILLFAVKYIYDNLKKRIYIYIYHKILQNILVSFLIARTKIIFLVKILKVLMSNINIKRKMISFFSHYLRDFKFVVYIKNVIKNISYIVINR